MGPGLEESLGPGARPATDSGWAIIGMELTTSSKELNMEYSWKDIVGQRIPN